MTDNFYNGNVLNIHAYKESKKMTELQKSNEQSNPEVDLHNRVNAIFEEYKNDPRNKIFLDSHILALSAQVESGKNHSQEAINTLIKKHLENSLAPEEVLTLDHATAVCYELAQKCFEIDTDSSITISFLENDSGFLVEIRPS